MKVISISGGRSSAMMLKIMQDNGQIDAESIVCFANTGKESPATLDFIEECSVRWGIPVVWLEFQAEKPFFQIVNYQTAARSGEPFAAKIKKSGYLPNPTQRICTAELKIKTIRRYVRSLGHKGAIDSYIGLRYDEPDRVAKKKAQNAAGKESEYCYMPLYDLRVTIAERDAFWKAQPFDLAISSHSDNCDLCFLKGKMALIWKIRENPAAAQWWIDQEKAVSATAKRKRNAQFRKEYSYTDLLNYAEKQTYMFEPPPPDQSITCSCTD
jgi:hypothetical protein